MNPQDEAKIILAFLFKRSGKNQVKEAELYLPLSLELKWLSSSQANQFVQYCIHNKLLKKVDNAVTPTFEVKTIEIPVGFQPSTTQFPLQPQPSASPETQTEDQGIFQQLLTASKFDKKQLEHDIQQLAKNKGITKETAMILWAYSHDIPVGTNLEPARKKLSRENAG